MVPAPASFGALLLGSSVCFKFLLCSELGTVGQRLAVQLGPVLLAFCGHLSLAHSQRLSSVGALPKNLLHPLLLLSPHCFFSPLTHCSTR